jgi:hypothetical protein
MAPSGQRVALAGAGYSAVVSLTYLASVAAATTAGVKHWSIAIPAMALEPKAFDSPVPAVVAASVASAALAGALIGPHALRTTGSPRQRVAKLSLTAVPALYLAVALSLLLLYAPQVAREGPSALVALPFGCLLFALVGASFMLPTAAVPMVLLAAMIEGVTRTDGASRGGLASARARRLILQILAAIGAGCATFAWLP